MRTINEIPSLFKNIEKRERLKGAVLFPGKDTLKALEKATALLPVDFTVYGSESADGAEPFLGNSCYSFVPAGDPVAELSRCLSADTTDGNVRYDFAVRGDLLSLDHAYEGISRASLPAAKSAENALAKGEQTPKEEKTSRPGAGSERRFWSHVAVLDTPTKGRVLVISDGFVNPRPDVNVRLAIIRNGIGVCKTLGMSFPRVALLAAVEQVYPGMPVTVESEEITRLARKGAITGASVEGPLSFDVALVEEAAREKGTTGDVAGRADFLVGSSIEVISGIYMAQTILVRSNAASVVVGGGVPLALPFPSDCVGNIFLSICLASLLSVST